LGEAYGNKYLDLELPTVPPSWTGASTIHLLFMGIVLANLLKVMHKKQLSRQDEHVNLRRYWTWQKSSTQAIPVLTQWFDLLSFMRIACR
jgi:hypothetical protein